MDVEGYPFQGTRQSLKTRYLGSLINHCKVKYGSDIYKCYKNLTKKDETETIVLNYNIYNPSFEFTLLIFFSNTRALFFSIYSLNPSLKNVIVLSIIFIFLN